MANSPFDYAKSINNKKDYLMVGAVEEKEYTQYIVNKIFSSFPETILHANELNCLPGLDNKYHYDYLMNAIPYAKSRYSPWVKPKDDEDISAISEYYKLNKHKAKELTSILSREQKDKIKQILKKE